MVLETDWSLLKKAGVEPCLSAAAKMKHLSSAACEIYAGGNVILQKSSRHRVNVVFVTRRGERLFVELTELSIDHV